MMGKLLFCLGTVGCSFFPGLSSVTVLGFGTGGQGGPYVAHFAWFNVYLVVTNDVWHLVA